MSNTGLHRYALLLAFCTLLLVVAGGLVTSNDAGLSVPDWPLSYGKLMPPMEGGILYEHGHRMVATLVGMLTIGMAIWLWRAESRAWLRRLGWIAVAAVIAQGVLGGLTVIYLLPPAVSVSHACLAQLFFSTTVAFALFTSKSWIAGDRTVADTGAPSLRTLAIAAPVFVLGQLALGAGARHKALGAIYHIAASPAVAAVLLLLCVRILMHGSGQESLRRSALATIAIVFTQIFLGIAAYMSRIATADAVQPMPVMVLFTVLHVAVGALTMAASVVTAIEVLRYVRRPAGELATDAVAVPS